MIRIALGSDHRGFLLKRKIKNFLRQEKIAAIDVGTHINKACDYPLFAKKVATLVYERKVNFCKSYWWWGIVLY